MDEFKVSTSCRPPATAMAFVSFSMIYAVYLSFNECRCYKTSEILILDLFLLYLVCLEKKCALSLLILKAFVSEAARFMILFRSHTNKYFQMCAWLSAHTFM